MKTLSLLSHTIAWMLALTAPALAQEDFRAEEAVEIFDIVWETVRDEHFDPEVAGVDWEAVRDELRPRTAAIESRDELRGLLNEMLSRLGQSHFVVIPGEVQSLLTPDEDEKVAPEPDPESPDSEDPEEGASENGATEERADEEGEPGADDDDADEEESTSDEEGGVGLWSSLLGDEVVVVKVVPGSSAAKAGVKPGWVIQEINGREVAGLVEQIPEDLGEGQRAFYGRQIVHARLEGDVGTKAALTFLDENGEPVELRLARTPKLGKAIKFGNLPEMHAHFEKRWLDDEESLGYIAFNVWMLPNAMPFDRAIDEMREADGIVIDLRNNPGGVGMMAMGLGGHFFDERTALGVMKRRRDRLEFQTNPRTVSPAGKRVKPYAGPVALLVDRGTASTSEIFAGGMQFHGRARVFGQTSMGAALPAVSEGLPNGDVFLRAIADYVLPDGTHIEGRGVVPDEPVTLTRELLLEDPDPVLSAALRWLQAPGSSKSPGSPKSPGSHEDPGSQNPDAPGDSHEGESPDANPGSSGE